MNDNEKMASRLEGAREELIYYALRYWQVKIGNGDITDLGVEGRFVRAAEKYALALKESGE